MQPQGTFAELATVSLADHTIDRVMAKVTSPAATTLHLRGDIGDFHMATDISATV
jgi:hypothetical protein